MDLHAAFFDVGDTLVEHWAAPEVLNAKARAQVCAELGELPWIDDLLGAWIEPPWPVSVARTLARRGEHATRFAPEEARQVTTEWYGAWFRHQKIDLNGLDLDRLRALICVPLVEISTPVRGAFEAVRWCKERGMRVVLVTNTLARGDEEALADWRGFGLDDAIDAIVTSHDAGWRKPHPGMFERALEAAAARPEEAFHVGDNLIADVWGAQQLGMRAVWRRSDRARPVADRDRPGHDPWIERRQGDPATCEHPSETLFLRDGDAICGACGADTEILVRPDAVIDDLTELPAVVERWRG